MAAAAVERKQIRQRFRCRNICFTSFKIVAIAPKEEEVRAMDYQEEVAPGTQRHHLQGCAQSVKPLGLEGWKAILNDPAAHIEKMRGTYEQAKTYAHKEATRFIGGLTLSFGKPMVGGERTDLASVKAAISGGMKPVDLR